MLRFVRTGSRNSSTTSRLSMKLATELVVKALPVDRHGGRAELKTLQPQEVGQRAGDLVHDPDGATLVVAQVRDHVDLVLELGLAGLEALDLGDDRLQFGDRLLRAPRSRCREPRSGAVCRPSSRRSPSPPTTRQRTSAQPATLSLVDVQGTQARRTDRRPLLSFRDEIDPDHAFSPPVFRIARPTETANIGEIDSQPLRCRSRISLELDCGAKDPSVR